VIYQPPTAAPHSCVRPQRRITRPDRLGQRASARRLEPAEESARLDSAMTERRSFMKVLNPLKAPFGRGKFSRVKDVSFEQWEVAFAVEFDDGLSFLEPLDHPQGQPDCRQGQRAVGGTGRGIAPRFFCALRQRSGGRSLLGLHPRTAPEEMNSIARTMSRCAKPTFRL